MLFFLYHNFYYTASSIADHKVLSQANYNESVQLGGTPSDYPLNRSKAMMFEDLVLQSIRYDGDTITLTVPDYLPESQRWAIGTLIKIMILQ